MDWQQASATTRKITGRFAVSVMKHDVLVSGRSTATVLAVALAAALTAGKESRADAISDLLNGKKISITIRCENQTDQGGVSTASLNSKGNLLFKRGAGFKPLEFVNGKANWY